jgi:flavin-dependent dehydrogenase
MKERSIKTVAVLGGGPAGSTVATYLARKGIDVVMFADGKRPPLIVGESLVPAVVPFLRDLGIEDEVASYGTWKGGATFIYNTEYRLNIWFDEVRGGKTPTYSYNVPRDRFDATLRDTAVRAGAVLVEGKGRIERDGDSQRMRLSEETLAAAENVLHGRQPDWVVDAMGRGRGIPKLLDLPVDAGDRRDTALHAHMQGVEVPIATNVHTDRLTHGWCWRIPLQGRVSVGFILDSDFARTLGGTNEEQFDNFMQQDPTMREWSKSGRRITPVIRYSNYQARVRQGVGENWALVGDSFGFVDPVFSSGMLIAFQSARALADAIEDGSPRAFAEYEAFVKKNLDCWRNVIVHYYDGRLLTLFKVGQHVQKRLLGKLMAFHFRKHMPRIFTGDDVTNRYSTWLIEFMSTWGIYGNDPEEYRIL